MTLRAVVVEDQHLARRHLRTLLEEVEGVEWVGEAADGPSALRVVSELRPDLLFLDIKLPRMSGLDVLRQIEPGPFAIFTTAYDRHAVTAFELQAIDYILKPFGADRLRQAVERAIELGGGAEIPELAERVAAASRSEPLTRVFVRTRGRIVPVVLETVEHLEAEGDYVALWEGSRSHLVRVSMNHLMERVDERTFVRVHRSHAVNLSRVAAFVPEPDGRLVLELESGKRLIASRSRSPELRQRLNRL